VTFGEQGRERLRDASEVGKARSYIDEPLLGDHRCLGATRAIFDFEQLGYLRKGEIHPPGRPDKGEPVHIGVAVSPGAAAAFWKGQQSLPLVEPDRPDAGGFGPVLPRWPHYSRLGEITHHCHLADKWVACWRNECDSLLVEVYYAGSRESAPY
jgi:hypothetical protein